MTAVRKAEQVSFLVSKGFITCHLTDHLIATDTLAKIDTQTIREEECNARDSRGSLVSGRQARDAAKIC